jgi:hypothetical protein
MKKKITIIVLIILVIVGTFFVYFKLHNATVPQNEPVQEEQTNEQKVSSFFEALKNSNYQQLSKNFTEELASELTEEEMPKLRKIIFDNLGDLINLKEPETMPTSNDRTLLVYYADFEKETGVMIKASFTKDGKLSTIYLDSPKLREAAGK